MMVMNRNNIKHLRFVFQTFLWMVLGLTSVTTISLSRANTSVSFACTKTDASIPAGRRRSGDTFNELLKHLNISDSRGFKAHFTPSDFISPGFPTLDSDVSYAAATVTHLHVETTQHGEQLEGKHTAIFGSFRHCERAETRVKDTLDGT